MITKLPVASDLSVSALDEAAARLPRPRTYVLKIHPSQLDYAKDVIKMAQPEYPNRFAPQINIEMVEHFDKDAWELWCEGDCVWSPGV